MQFIVNVMVGCCKNFMGAHRKNFIRKDDTLWELLEGIS
jgi:hypothetical protein